jgi:hypothetical protein
MTEGSLAPGDGLLLRAFTDHPADTVKLSYGPPKEKGRYYLTLWLGTWKEGEADVDARLNALGWVFDPERAREALKSFHNNTGDST